MEFMCHSNGNRAFELTNGNAPVFVGDIPVTPPYDGEDDIL